ncbi:hypothetical protein BH09ACT8_BH09ACT8_56070 [soil metagenome]
MQPSNESPLPGASASGRGAGDSMRMGSGAVSGNRVLVRDLVAVAYRGRRVRFADITGTVDGLHATAAIGITPEDQAVPLNGRPVLAVTDDLGRTHHLEFGAHDYVTLLD